MTWAQRTPAVEARAYEAVNAEGWTLFCFAFRAPTKPLWSLHSPTHDYIVSTQDIQAHDVTAAQAWADGEILTS